MFWRSRWFERSAPLSLGILTLVGILWWRVDIARQFAPNNWQPANLYGAVFNWASIQSGFVFGIYGFIATKRDGFAGEMFGGSTFQSLLSYTRRAYLSGFALTFASLPILVVSPQLTDAAALSFWIVSAWFASFVWTFCAFLRVAFIFGMIVATPDRPERIIG